MLLAFFWPTLSLTLQWGQLSIQPTWSLETVSFRTNTAFKDMPMQDLFLEHRLGSIRGAPRGRHPTQGPLFTASSRQGLFCGWWLEPWGQGQTNSKGWGDGSQTAAPNRLLGPTSRASDPVSLGGAQESAFLTGALGRISPTQEGEIGLGASSSTGATA